MRYVIHPGYVVSRRDGQTHFIGSKALANLYKVSIDDPKVIVANSTYEHEQGDVKLAPKWSGDYTLPPAE